MLEEISDAQAAAPGGEVSETEVGVSPSRGRRRKLKKHTWVLRRIGIGGVTLFLVSVIIFAATQALPGNAARQLLGRNQNAVALHDLEQRLGLNKSAVVQYWDWLKGVLHGDFGMSYSAHEPVTTLLRP